jgi:hypothetical protein
MISNESRKGFNLSLLKLDSIRYSGVIIVIDIASKSLADKGTGALNGNVFNAT